MARVTRYCAACLTTFFDDPERCTNLGCGAARPPGGWGQLLGPGDLLDRHYLVERVLAVGGAGLTYLAQEADAEKVPHGPKVAIKVLYTARDTGPFLRRLANEAQILQELSHEHIVKCLGFVQRVGQEPYLVTRFEEGGSLQQHVDRVGPLPARVAVGILRQVLLALDVAHQRAVVHRDLKPDNVLLSNLVPATEVPHVRVADFGIAKVHGGLTDRLTKLGSFVGTPEYAAPEQFEGLPPTPATDLFAAGGLLWFLVTGRAPIRFTQRHDLGTSYEELMDQIPPRLEGSGSSIIDPNEMHTLQDVLDHLMDPHPEARWTVHQVLHRLMPLTQPMGRGVNTLEFTDSGAPDRAASPTFPLDEPNTAFAREHDTAVPTLDSASPTIDDGANALRPPASAAPVASPPPPPEAPDRGAASATPEPVPRSATPEPVPRSATPEPAPRATPPPTDRSATPAPAEARPSLPPAPPPPSTPSAPTTAWLPREPESAGTPAPVEPAPAPVLATPTPIEAAPTSTGGAVRAAGCLGLSFVGVTASGAVGLVFTASCLLLGAWGFGWFAGGSARIAPVVVRAEPPAVWSRTPQLFSPGNTKWSAKRHNVQDAVSAQGAVIGRTCTIEGPLVAELLIEPDGRVVYALVDEEWFPLVDRACTEAQLSRLKLDLRLPREMRVRVAFTLGG